jgi:predicted dehydrogenase
VIIETSENEAPQLVCTDKGGYKWQEGARVVGESMITGIEPLINVEHALHVLEIIEAARISQQEGKRIRLTSEFPFPVIR